MSTSDTQRGDHYNCLCPHCGKNNNYVTRDVEVPFRKIQIFTKACWHCGQTVHYRASWELQVTASTSEDTL